MKKHGVLLLFLTLALCGTLLLLGCDQEKTPDKPCAQGHSFEEEITKDPTCTEAGAAKRVCTVCGTEREEEKIPATGHKESGWNVTLQPTCTEPGSRCTTCETCGETIVTESIAASGHTSVGGWVVDVEPTCTKAGKRHTAACSVCGAIDIVEPIPKTGHDSTDFVTVSAPTCTDQGTQQKTCNTCGTVTETQVINALSHAFSAWEIDPDNTLRVRRFCTRAECGAEFEGHTRSEHAVESGAYASVRLPTSLSYSDDVSTAFKKKMQQLANKIYGYTNSSVSLHANSTSGLRVQTGEDAAISGHGFAIKRSGSAITIVGTTSLITQMGVDYFMNTYVTGATITLPELVVSDNYEMVDISGYVPVYGAQMDDADQAADDMQKNPDTYYGVSSETGRDYAVDVAFEIAELLGSSVRKDSAAASGGEILIGATARDQTAIAQAYLKGHEYGILVMDGTVVITGYSVAALHKAAPLFYDYLADAEDENGQILFPKNFWMVSEVSDRWLTDETLLPDLPLSSTADEGDGAFQYLYKGNGVDKAAFDAYVAALKGMGFTVLTESNAEGSYFVTLTDAANKRMIHVSYEAYAHANDTVAGREWAAVHGSESAIRVVTAYINNYYGYIANTRPDEFTQSQESKTYESGWRKIYYSYEGVSLSDYLNSLTNKGFVTVFTENTGAFLVQNAKGERVYAYVPADRGSDCIAVCYYTPGVIELPSALYNANQSYTKVTDTKIVSIDLSNTTAFTKNSYGTGYVIMLEDGRFVIIDGGNNDGGASGNHAWAQVNNFWSIIKALYKDVYGTEPSERNPAHIAAWIITHAHGDHMNMFWDFTSPNNEHQKKIKLDYLIANSPDYTMLYNTGESSMDISWELAKFQNNLKSTFKFVRPQTGQKIYLANLEIETLFTHGDLNPQRIVTLNDSSIVQRLTFVRTADGDGSRSVNHNTADAASKTSFLSTGDAYRWSGRWMAAMYGTYLKTDMVSVAHHGGVGVTAEFYDLVSPTVVWWSNQTNSVYDAYLNPNGTAWNYKVDQHLAYDVDSVQYIYVADDYHITLVLKEDGPDHNGIYNATDKEAIDCHSVSKAGLKTGSASAESDRKSLCSNKHVAIKKI